MKLTELFSTLATRAGIDATDAKLTELLATLPDTEVDDETLANKISANLITESEAENRPTIKSKFTAQALNGVDALLTPVLAEFFDETEIAGLDKSTTKRLGKLLDKAKAAKVAGGNSTDAAKAIETLNAEITRIKADSETTMTTLKSDFERQRYFDKLATKVIGRNDVTDYAKAKEGKRVLSDFNDTLDTLGGVVDLATGKVMRKDDPTQQLYLANKPLTVDAVLEQTLTENDYLKKSEPAQKATVTVPGAKPDAGISEAARRNLERAAKEE